METVDCSRPDSRGRVQWLLALGAISLLTASVYGPNLGHPFQYDDLGKILHNPELMNPLGYFRAFGDADYTEATTRLVPNLTFYLNHELFGWESFGYHLTNLLFHLANICLVALLGRAVLLRLGRSEPAVPLLGAAIFALHPLNSEAVSYCNARPNLIATTFFLLALLAFLKALQAQAVTRPTRAFRWALFAVAATAALLSKELAVTLVLMAPLLAFWIEGAKPGQSSRALKPIAAATAILVVLGPAMVFLTRAHLGLGQAIFDPGGDQSESWPLAFLLSFLGQCEVLLRYFWLALLPFPGWLNADHARASLWSLVEAANGEIGATLSALVLPVLSALALLAYALVGLRLRRRSPFVSFFLLWPLVAHAPTLIVPRKEVMVEYRTYLPMVGVCLLLAWGLTRAWSFAAQRWGRSQGARGPIAAAAAATLLLAALAAGTAVRNRAWASARALWLDAATKAPQNPRALSNLGKELAKQGRLDEAATYLKRALEVAPDFADAHSGMAALLVMRGKIEEAVDHFRLALEEGAETADALNNLGNALTQKGMLDEALRAYRRAMKAKPGAPDTHNNIGMALFLKGKTAEAIRHYRNALRVAPELVETRYNLGIALSAAGQRKQAIEQFRRALSIDPGYAKAYNNLGVALAAEGQEQEAIRNYRKALSIQPDNAQANYNLGVSLAAEGELRQAAEQYRRAIQIQPDHAEAHTNLGIVYLRQSEPARAEESYRKALQIKPDLFQARLNLAIALAARGELTEALAQSKYALQINPSHPVAQRVFQSLQSRAGDETVVP